jgi:hypothetical protein
MARPGGLDVPCAVGLPLVILIPPAGGPSWADIMTAFGTCGAVVAAVSIALWTEWRSGRRLAAEQARSDRQLEEERARSMAEIEEERRIGRESEQLAEAYAVQVVAAEAPIRFTGDQGTGKQLGVILINRGKFTITRVQAQFSPDGMSLISHHSYRRVPGFDTVPEDLRAAWKESAERAMYGVLTPWDTGIHFASDTVHDRFLKSPYPVVRWTDRWGTRWEHRRGEVRQVADDEPWTP